ncbi:MAG: hypothetical protein JWP87_5954 [Labilithrix sp.]|nr:hypothetical protein [Labilithrix sp.]
MNPFRRHLRATSSRNAAFLALSALSLAGCFWGDGITRGSGGYAGYDPGRGTPSPPPSGVNVGTQSGCVDPSGFGGRGCFKCAPTTSDELLAACTTSHYEEFDNALRIAGFDPANPKPTVPDQGPTPPPFDPGTTTETDPGTPPPPCPIDTKPNPVLVLGATGFPMETIAKAMGSAATIFYEEKGSCDGIATIVLNQRLSGEVVYYDPDGTKNRCMLQQEHPADLTVSALFAQTCANESGLAEPVALPPDVQDFLGPVSPVMFAAPATSKQRAISAEAAYKVYGFGAQSGVAPWTDEQYVFRRRPSSGNQQTVALTLGLPADALRGRDSSGSTAMLTALLQSNAPEKTIGISSSEIVDTNRDVMKALAYKHYNQPVAFYPDSDPANLDRRNVRDGHYFMWMPLHVLARTSGGDPVAVQNAALDTDATKKAARNASVKRLVFVMVSRQQAPVPSVDLFGALKRNGIVPQCAMKVRRAKEGAPLESYTPAVSCDCAFEAALPGTTRPDCTPCRDSSECSSGKATCSFGFCE